MSQAEGKDGIFRFWVQGSGFWVQRFRVKTTLNAEPLNVEPLNPVCQKKGSAISGVAFLGLYDIWIRMPANPAGTRF